MFYCFTNPINVPSKNLKYHKNITFFLTFNSKASKDSFWLKNTVTQGGPGEGIGRVEKESSQVEEKRQKEEFSFSPFLVKYPIYGVLQTMITK